MTANVDGTASPWGGDLSFVINHFSFVIWGKRRLVLDMSLNSIVAVSRPIVAFAGRIG